MAPTLHVFDRGMTVMDGRRCVASARKWANGLWILTLRGGAWIGARTEPQKLAQAQRMGMSLRIVDHLKVVKTKREARRWMAGLCGS